MLRIRKKRREEKKKKTVAAAAANDTRFPCFGSFVFSLNDRNTNTNKTESVLSSCQFSSQLKWKFDT